MEEALKKAIRNIPDFPKPGIQFKDITPIFLNPSLVNQVLEHLVKEYSSLKPEAIVGIESRGFLLGPALAARLNVPFVLVRKKGKLPAKTISYTYSLEYGTDTIEIHEDGLKGIKKAIVHDDLLATGGTALATAELVKKAGAEVINFSFIVELSFLNGKSRLNQIAGVHSLVTY